MTCPKCNSCQIAVVDSRPQKRSVRRRRKCMECGARFNTLEIIVESGRKQKE